MSISGMGLLSSLSPQNRFHHVARVVVNYLHCITTDLLFHTDKQLVKVSLSPQRRSFQRGCSWKEKNLANGNNSSLINSSPNDTTPTSSPLKTTQSDHQLFTFDDQKSHPSYTSNQRHSNTSGSRAKPSTANSTNTPRVIHHVPLRDKKHPESRHDSRIDWDAGGGQDSSWKKSSRANHVRCGCVPIHYIFKIYFSYN